MKKLMFHTLLFTLAATFWGCGGSDSDSTPPAPSVTITVSQETVNVPAEGATYTINVTTTGKEWGAYVDQDFVSIDARNQTSQSGTIIVKVAENPYTVNRSASIFVMSGAARKTISITQAAAAEAAYNAPDGYQLVWNDEFDKGTSLNGNDWTHEVQRDHWVNNELQNYEGWTYGYIEASIKLPKGKGTWPAFWMMPVNFRSWPADGEIDIMEEVGYHANYVSSSLHANAHVHSNNTQVTHEMYCAGAEGEFHTYAILWTAKNITTYVDGQVQLSYDNRGLGRDDWPYDDPFYVIFNLAWGGDWGGAQGVDESALPAVMEVDYVRVFQKK